MNTNVPSKWSFPLSRGAILTILIFDIYLIWLLFAWKYNIGDGGFHPTFVSRLFVAVHGVQALIFLIDSLRSVWKHRSVFRAKIDEESADFYMYVLLVFIPLIVFYTTAVMGVGIYVTQGVIIIGRCTY